jgi:hypothetical protein
VLLEGVNSTLKFTHGELTCADTGTEKVPDLPPMLTLPPVTNGVLKTAPDLVISVESVVKEKVNAEFENDSAFVAPVGVTLPDLHCRLGPVRKPDFTVSHLR